GSGPQVAQFANRVRTRIRPEFRRGYEPGISRRGLTLDDEPVSPGQQSLNELGEAKAASGDLMQAGPDGVFECTQCHYRADSARPHNCAQIRSRLGGWSGFHMPGRFSNEPLELAGSEAVEQPPWQEDPHFVHGDLGYKTKVAPLGDDDYLHFEALADREGKDPDIESVRAEHGLDYPHEVLWSRGPGGTSAAGGRFDITGEGKAGQLISHASQALRELVHRYRPVSIEFSAHEPSREKAYHHMMRRLARENVGGGEYAFLHEPGREF